MPEIRFLCPNCGSAISSEDQATGYAIPCPSCGKQATIPGSSDVDLPPTTETVVYVHREWALPGWIWKWVVCVDGKAVGRLGNGATLCIPLIDGQHAISFGHEVTSEAAFTVTIPQDRAMLYCVKHGTLRSSRRVAREDVASLAPTKADISGDYRPKAPFQSQQVFWQRSALLLMIYWLIRWLWPGVLPVELRNADFHMTMFVCAMGGGVLTGISWLIHMVKPDGSSSPADS